MEKATGKAYVYVNQQFADVARVVQDIKSGKNESMTSTFISCHDHNGKDGFVLVGISSLSIDWLTDKEVQTAQVTSLQEVLRAHLAESEKKANYIRDQISKLLAITDGTV